MIILDSLMMTLILFMSVIFCVEDIKNKKIYNKLVVPICVIGIVLHIIFGLNNYSILIEYLLSLLLIIIISVLLYYFEIWAGGDSKLVIAFMTCIPFWCIQKFSYFSVIYILIIVFSISFIYIIGESLWLCFKGEKNLKAKDIFNINTIVRMFVYSGIYSLIRFVESFLFGNSYIIFNMIFYMLNIFVLLFVRKYDYLFMKKKILYCFCIWGIYVLFRGFRLDNVVWNSIFVIVLFMCRWFAEQYNYQEIKTDDVKEGMVLSYMTVSFFQKSKVKGLPVYTQESIKTRITAEEAESIHRWKTSKYGKDTIVIVRKIPFAIFICIGLIAFLGIGAFI